MEKCKTLEEWEEICPDCEGTGKACSGDCDEDKCYDNGVRLCIDSKRCVKCGGTGKLDWLEKIFGKKKTTFEQIIFGLNRVHYPKLVAKDLVDVQPIHLDTEASVVPMFKAMFEVKND